MHSLPKPVYALALVACVIAVIGVITLLKPHEPQSQSHQVVFTSTEPDAPTENVSPPAAEPEWPMSNASPVELIQGTLDAIEREDRAWLARTLESTSGLALNEDHLHAAYRQFLWRSAQPMWARIRAAWNVGTWEIVDDADSAVLVLQVGGALGEMRLQLVQREGVWLYKGV